MGRPLRYDDLGKEGRDAAKAGLVQVLPSRDRAGRLVVVHQVVANNRLSEKDEMSDLLRLLFYTFSVVSEDAETQKRGGAVFIQSANEEAMRAMNDPSNREEYESF